MKAALINLQNIVENVIVWNEGDVWSGNEQVVVVDDSVVVGVGYTYDGGTSFTAPAPAPIPDSQKLAWCKNYASHLLYETDWTTIPDVIDPANNPYLMNQADFIAYRNQVRQLAVNPVIDPVFPDKPTAQWSQA